jgi:hypothetical protein
VPAGSPAVLRLTVTCAGVVVAVPELGLTLSHDAFSVRLHVKVPPPVLLIVKVLAAGLAPPTTPVKFRLRAGGLSPMVAGGGVSVKVTGICCEPFVAPGVVIVMGTL